MKRQITSQIFTVWEEDGIVHIRFDEEPTVDVLKSALQAVNDIEDHHLRYWDFTNVRLNGLSAKELRSLANLPTEEDVTDQGEGRIAYVVSHDFTYGLGRMFEVYREETGVSQMRIFRDVPDEAIAWLRAEG
ncbi:MAG: hypothetical protein O7F71_14225 [Gammaproteobacteria bacterium]|nr:hypothetical protein [Gammaproteobacteria bacterium]